MKAAPPFPHTVIRASAGTGKTYQLSNRYLALAFAGEPFDSILATTFTRKAAGEILDRIIARLAQAVEQPEKRAQLARDIGRAELGREACLRLLAEMVRSLHRLRIGTLDSFFLQMARSFSLEAGLPPGWQIGDELADRRLRSEAVRLMFEEEPTRSSLELIHLLTKGQTTRSVVQQIDATVNGLYALFCEMPEAAWESLPRTAGLNDDELAEVLVALESAELPADKRCTTARDKDLSAARLGQWAELFGRGLAAKVADGSCCYQKKELPPATVAIYQKLLEHAKAVVVGQIVNQTNGTRRLLERFDRAYERLKLRQRSYRFDDIARRLTQQDLDGRLETIAYRLDGHVSHLLLDEFQDTNPVQWRVLRAFARRAVDGSAGRSFFCVGDVKQAIYGWRGGLAAIFDQLDRDLGSLKVESLDTSYRSCQAVIDTTNRVFCRLETALPDKHRTAAARWQKRFSDHSTARHELRGYCRMVVAPAAAEGELPTERNLIFAAAEVARLKAEAPGRSIAVLVRTNQAVARTIFELRQLDIEASEEGGNPLTDSVAVQMVLSLLTLADHPGDLPARYHLASSPLGATLGYNDHRDDARSVSLSRQLRGQLIVDGYGRTIRRWVDDLAASCDPRELGRLVQLVELAYRYEDQATCRVDDFIELVNTKRIESPTAADVRVMTVHQAKGLQFDIVVLPELDARLVGQTPPVVVGRPAPTEPINRVCHYVNETTRALLPQPFQHLFDEYRCQVVEEQLCVLYVALTRAVHALYIIVSPSQREPQECATLAGLLRAALSAGPAEAGQVLFEHGDPLWSRHQPAAPRQRPLRQDDEPPRTVELAQLRPRPWRGLDRRSPSQLEGGSKIDLRFRLRLDTAEALAWGTLMHKCFEQVEWLDRHQPSDAELREALAPVLPPGWGDDPCIAAFRQAIAFPAVKAALSLESYRQMGSPQGGSVLHAASAREPRWEVFRELNFAVRDGDILLSGAMDRLVVLYDGPRPVGAQVVDFKTDTVALADRQAIAERLEVYRPQIDAYRRAAAAMLALSPERIEARLAFVRIGEVLAL